MPGQDIRISASDGGTFGAYLALPGDGAASPAPGIVMLHEIFGVTGWIRETADMFAAHGYCVAAPEMFWRLEPDFVADHDDAAQRQQGLQHKADLDHGKAVEDIAAVMAHLKSLPECNGRIGVTGFCTGGTLAYLAATRLKPDAAVAYYGTQIHEFLDEGKNIACPAVFHMGANDDHVPADLADTLRAAVSGVSDIDIHLYEAGHAFAHTGRADHYVKDACNAAHDRTFEAFDRLK